MSGSRSPPADGAAFDLVGAASAASFSLASRRPRCSIVGIFAKGTATRDDIHPAAGHPHRRPARLGGDAVQPPGEAAQPRSEEHTSELQSLMRISYAVFCLTKKTNQSSYHK